MIKLRKLELDDLEEYKFWKLPHHKYHSFNGPYFEKDSEKDIEEQIQQLRAELLQGKTVLEHKRIISNAQNEIIGEVSWYWRSKETHWLEIGIAIFNEKFWNKGIGQIALTQWIDKIFDEKKEIIRLGISTWSGNFGMIKLAEKLGMKKEACYRKARIIDGKYYDSISYGILKSEW
ncbi:GNAT family protein [Aquimarina sp. 2201CG1-2-11]|uniref:GNAT family N-acetyltransferase n=1 Tax=Aquimarina discodermiae TaxID=3231043 RepID=UPI0034630963